ncbi:hypothetical protein B0H14DRAFT_3464596 [Mycena olivaceomarginata]|nr:hypothetical protein B0H14DRAFT_3464596 [Mycena olivaceomarginata]
MPQEKINDLGTELPESRISTKASTVKVPVSKSHDEKDISRKLQLSSTLGASNQPRLESARPKWRFLPSAPITARIASPPVAGCPATISWIFSLSSVANQAAVGQENTGSRAGKCWDSTYRAKPSDAISVESISGWDTGSFGDGASDVPPAPGVFLMFPQPFVVYRVEDLLHQGSRSFFLLLAAALGISAAVASHAPLEINTPVPGAAQCEPLLITWSGGIRASTSSLVPLTLSVQTNPIQPMPLVDFGLVTGNVLTWVVNATLGQSLILEVTDDEANGLHTVTSAPFNVIAGAGDGCIDGN